VHISLLHGRRLPNRQINLFADCPWRDVPEEVQKQQSSIADHLLYADSLIPYAAGTLPLINK
jgi:hypothetical protein